MKMMVHFILLILSSSYAFLQSDLDQTMVNPQVQSFYFYFLNPENKTEDYNQLTDEYPKSLLILDVGTLNNFIAESVEKFYNIDNDDIGQMLLSDVHRI